MAVNPYSVNNAYLFNTNSLYNKNYNPAQTHEDQKIVRLIYSFFLYFLFIIGLYNSHPLISYKIKILVIFFFFYFLFFANLIYPSSRYFAPALIFMSIFISISINVILKKLKKFNN